jgi:hypothetical protein
MESHNQASPNTALKQLLALKAVAICLHSALVGNVATGEEASEIDAQASKELSVKFAV